MKFFGEFLVEKNLVTDEVLVDALIEQLKSMPSLTEIAFETKLFPAKSFLSILSLQTNEKLDFKTAAEKLGLWSVEIEERVSRTLSEKKIPLGQILVRNGKVGFEDITKALDEYLSGLENFTKSAPVVETPVLTAVLSALEPEAKAEPAIPQAVEPQVSEELPVAPPPEVVVSLDQTSDDTPNFLLIDPSSIQNYSALLDDGRLVALKSLLSVIQTGVKGADGMGPEDSMVLLWQGLHEVRGLARFIQASLTENLVTLLEESAELGMNNFALVTGPVLTELVSLFQQSIEEVWKIRQVLIERCSEESYWLSSKDAYLSLTSGLTQLKAKLSQGSVKEAA